MKVEREWGVEDKMKARMKLLYNMQMMRFVHLVICYLFLSFLATKTTGKHNHIISDPGDKPVK